MPLILPSQRLIRPNPLAYPAGATPGIDPAHPATQTGLGGVVFSTVAVGGNFIDVSKGTRGVISGNGFTSKIDGNVGAAGNFANDTNIVTFPIQGVLNTSTTIAAIVRTGPTATGVNQYAITTYTGAVGLGYAITYASGQINLVDPNGNILTIGTTLATADTPLFIAASVNLTSLAANFVIVNLATGRKTFGSSSITGGSGTKTSIFIGGRDDGIRPWAGSVAAGMMTISAGNTMLSLEQLQQWADDPWSFWYPRRTIQYTTPATTTTSGGARIRQRWNRSPLAYPAGAVPGIDPSHPAAQNIVASAVISGGGNFVNLVTGLPLTSQFGSTAPLAGVDAGVGPSSFANATTSFIYGVPTTSTPTVRTLGAIFKYVAKVGAGVYQGIVNYRISGNGFFIVDDVLDWYQGGDTSSGLTLTAGHSYFVAASAINNSGTTYNFVVKDLTTGAVKTSQVATIRATIADTAFAIGGDNANEYSNSRIAAAMYSQTYLSPGQLLAWSADAWSFWYPNNFKGLLTTGATPPAFLVSAVQSWPSLGRLIEIIGAD